eukprot:scaffold8026_cov444-Prasinococcus_capsulatus_cf.AAC.5
MEWHMPYRNILCRFTKKVKSSTRESQEEQAVTQRPTEEHLLFRTSNEALIQTIYSLKDVPVFELCEALADLFAACQNVEVPPQAFNVRGDLINVADVVLEALVHAGDLGETCWQHSNVILPHVEKLVDPVERYLKACSFKPKRSDAALTAYELLGYMEHRVSSDNLTDGLFEGNIVVQRQAMESLRKLKGRHIEAFAAQVLDGDDIFAMYVSNRNKRNGPNRPRVDEQGTPADPVSNPKDEDRSQRLRWNQIVPQKLGQSLTDRWTAVTPSIQSYRHTP